MSIVKPLLLLAAGYVAYELVYRGKGKQLAPALRQGADRLREKLNEYAPRVAEAAQQVSDHASEALKNGLSSEGIGKIVEVAAGGGTTHHQRVGRGVV